MRSLTALALGMVLAGLPPVQRANKPGADPQTIETTHVKITTSTGAIVDNTIPLLVDVVPKPRMHVYAPGQEGYIAVALKLDAEPGVTTSAPQFPKPEKIFFKALNETQLVYSKPFRIIQNIAVTRTQKPSILKGSLRYQACDEKVCFVPKTVAVEWRIVPKPV
jgi:DsbC/DsbD-like thiol-disulfide interchange protein